MLKFQNLLISGWLMMFRTFLNPIRTSPGQNRTCPDPSLCEWHWERSFLTVLFNESSDVPGSQPGAHGPQPVICGTQHWWMAFLILYGAKCCSLKRNTPSERNVVSIFIIMRYLVTGCHWLWPPTIFQECYFRLLYAIYRCVKSTALSI